MKVVNYNPRLYPDNEYVSMNSIFIYCNRIYNYRTFVNLYYLKTEAEQFYEGFSTTSIQNGTDVFLKDYGGVI